METLSIFFSRSRFRVVWHIIFWLLVLGYYTLFFGHQGGYYWLTFRFVIFMLPIAMGTTYFFNYYLIPKFLYRKKIWWFLLFSFYTLVVSFYLISLIIFPFLVISKSEVNMSELDKSLIDIYFLVVGMYTAVIIAILIKMLKTSYERQNLHLQLLKQKTEAELEMLRSQINPHFLFNTLNNIYTLSLKKSDQTPDVVLKLSEMLDYLLYECNAPKVPLKKEIQLIDNYLYLQKIRYGKRLEIRFNKENECSEKKIAPMLLLPFIENCFKHGVGKQRDHTWINIDVKERSDHFSFSVKNSLAEKNDQKKKNSSGGIGIANVRKRLSLLYPDHHELTIRDLKAEYQVELSLSNVS